VNLEFGGNGVDWLDAFEGFEPERGLSGQGYADGVSWTWGSLF
jgi:hypothetical protein